MDSSIISMTIKFALATLAIALIAAAPSDDEIGHEKDASLPPNQKDDSVEKQKKLSHLTIQLPSRGIVFAVVGGLAMLSLGYLLGNQLGITSLNVQASWPLFVVTALAIVAMSMAKDYVSERLNAKSIERVEEAVEEHKKTVGEIIEQKLAAYAAPLHTSESVRERASDLLRAVAEATDPTQKWVYYFGAAGLVRNCFNSEDSAASSQSRYRAALARLMGDRVPVTRYISLSTAREYSEMPPEMQRRYVQWVEQQVLQLERNPNYEMFNVSDAPSWGSSSNLIVTPGSMLSVVGDGISGLRINGQDVIKPYLDGWKQQFGSSDACPELITRENLIDYLENGLRMPPRITRLESRDQVIDAAADLISAALGAAEELEVEIVYMGAADLRANEDSEVITREYRKAMAELSRKRHPIKRYIRLLDVDEFQQRSTSTKESYLRWLEGQAELLSHNPSYEFYHCPRAQTWGGTRSSVFAGEQYVDIVGNGNSGLRVTGPNVVQELMEASRTLLDDAHVKPVRYSTSRLKTYMNKLKDGTPSRRKSRRRSVENN